MEDIRSTVGEEREAELAQMLLVERAIEQGSQVPQKRPASTTTSPPQGSAGWTTITGLKKKSKSTSRKDADAREKKASGAVSKGDDARGSRFSALADDDDAVVLIAESVSEDTDDSMDVSSKDKPRRLLLVDSDEVQGGEEESVTTTTRTAPPSAPTFKFSAPPLPSMSSSSNAEKLLREENQRLRRQNEKLERKLEQTVQTMAEAAQLTRELQARCAAQAENVRSLESRMVVMEAAERGRVLMQRNNNVTTSSAAPNSTDTNNTSEIPPLVAQRLDKLEHTIAELTKAVQTIAQSRTATATTNSSAKQIQNTTDANTPPAEPKATYAAAAHRGTATGAGQNLSADDEQVRRKMLDILKTNTGTTTRPARKIYSRNERRMTATLQEYGTVAVRSRNWPDKFKKVRDLFALANKTLPAQTHFVVRHGENVMELFVTPEGKRLLAEAVQRVNELVPTAKLLTLEGFVSSRPRDPNTHELLSNMVAERAARRYARMIEYLCKIWEKGSEWMPVFAERAAMVWHHCIHTLNIEQLVDKECRKAADPYPLEGEPATWKRLSDIARTHAKDAGKDGTGVQELVVTRGPIRFTAPQAEPTQAPTNKGKGRAKEGQGSGTEEPRRNEVVDGDVAAAGPSGYQERATTTATTNATMPDMQERVEGSDVEMEDGSAGGNRQGGTDIAGNRQVAAPSSTPKPAHPPRARTGATVSLANADGAAAPRGPTTQGGGRNDASGPSHLETLCAPDGIAWADMDTDDDYDLPDDMELDGGAAARAP
jgi:hypothetical protein